MSALRRRHRLGLMPLDLTSLVDVALMLAVFLLLGSRAAPVRGQPVELPRAGTGQPLAEGRDRPLRLVVDRDGGLHVDGRDLDLTDLDDLGLAGREVVVEADQDARHGRIVAILEALARNGAASVSYGVRPPAPAAGLSDW